MATVMFDTLKFVDKLEKAGVPKEQARAMSEAVKDSFESTEVATKRDLDDLRKEMMAMESRIIIRLGAVVVVVAGIITGILSMVISLHH